MNIITPGSYSSRSDQPWRGFKSQLWEQYRWRVVVPLVVAALVAFVPLALLVWWNSWRLQTPLAAQIHGPVLVKQGQFEQQQDEEEPGATGLLQINCVAKSFGDRRKLLADDDPLRKNLDSFDPYYVRREEVYLRKAGHEQLPFALLGKPPVSVWLPAGEYDVAVVHAAPARDMSTGMVPLSFPLVTVVESCKIEDRQKHRQDIELVHYDGGNCPPIHTHKDGLPSYLADLTSLVAIPTPNGYSISLPEPRVSHVEGHRDCAADFAELRTIPREWTRDQLATLRNWLPAESKPARERLSSLIDALQWREFFGGWYCYAIAGMTGLVFTRWGALAILEPWRRRQSFVETLKLWVKIFLIAAFGCFMLNVLAHR